jgi:hypothetical protein
MAVAGAVRDATKANGATLLANFALGGLGLLLLAVAWRMGLHWAEQHFLPVWTWSWGVQLNIVQALRLLVALAGLAVLFVFRPWFVRACAAGRASAAFGSSLRVILAVMVALVATELVLRTQTWRAAQEQRNFVDPLRVQDSELGWSLAANRAASVTLDGRVVHYATGPFGYRAPRAGAAPDFARPTVVFAGESVMFGYGLDWSETIPAQVQAMTGVQAANIAINAHATDQIYLRLRRELPRFAHPVAVVFPFMPRLLDRNLDSDKPHVDDRLRWRPRGTPPLRLVELTRRLLRYRDPADVAHGEVLTSRVLKAVITIAEAHGARAIVLVPQYLPETTVERRIRQAVLDNAGIPYLLVPVPPQWRSPTNYHPTRQGAAALAAAVSRSLR